MSRRWKFSELGQRDNHFNLHRTNTYHVNEDLDDKCKPPGFAYGFDRNQTEHISGQKGVANVDEDRQNLLMKQAWAQAKSPAKQILMTGLMMWMMGSSLSIFTLMMMGMMCLSNPLSALFQMQKAFARFESAKNYYQLWLPKLTYIGFNLVSIGIGIWKLNALGITPTDEHIPPSDSAPKVIYFVYFSFICLDFVFILYSFCDNK